MDNKLIHRKQFFVTLTDVLKISGQSISSWYLLRNEY